MLLSSSSLELFSWYRASYGKSTESGSNGRWIDDESVFDESLFFSSSFSLVSELMPLLLLLHFDDIVLVVLFIWSFISCGFIKSEEIEGTSGLLLLLLLLLLLELILNQSNGCSNVVVLIIDSFRKRTFLLLSVCIFYFSLAYILAGIIILIVSTMFYVSL